MSRVEYTNDFRSRWIHGVAASLVMLAVVVGLILLTIGMKHLGRVALLIESVVMLAAAGYLFHGSLRYTGNQVRQAWFGIMGGFAGWTFLEASALLGQVAIENERGVALFILVLVLYVILYRRGLETGPGFWGAAFLANWAGHLVLYLQRYCILQGYDYFRFTYRASGVMAGIGILLVYGWIFTRSRTPVRRLAASLSVFVLVIILVYSIRGIW